MGNNASVAVQPGRRERPTSDFFTETFSVNMPVHPGAYYVEQDTRRLGGVGIVFAVDENGTMVVYRLVKDGPAYRSGKVRRGDQLKTINGTILQPNAKKKPALSGWEGTAVKLGFTPFQADEPYVVELIRESFAYPDEIALAAPGFHSLVPLGTKGRNNTRDSAPASLQQQPPSTNIPPSSTSLLLQTTELPRSGAPAQPQSWTPGPTAGNPRGVEVGSAGRVPMASELFEWRYSQGAPEEERTLPVSPTEERVPPRMASTAIVQELRPPDDDDDEGVVRYAMPPEVNKRFESRPRVSANQHDLFPAQDRGHQGVQRVAVDDPGSGGVSTSLALSQIAAAGPSEGLSIREMAAAMLRQQEGDEGEGGKLEEGAVSSPQIVDI